MQPESMFAQRIGGASFGKSTELYKFEKIKRAKRQALQDRPEVELLDFGVGEPDRMAPEVIRQTLKTAVDRPENRGYADNGIPEYREAAALYMRRYFDVSLDPATQVNHSIGTKQALSLIPLAFVDPEDVILQTVPGYPVLATHTRYLGGEVVNLPLHADNGFMPDLTAVEPSVADRAKLIYVNYPNNPTGACATDAFFDELIAFADTHNILIIQDAPYATLVYGDQPRRSILQRPGADRVALELHSMSKAYNMTGWRLAFFAGAPWAVAAVANIKDNSDSGQFKAIQHAAAAGIRQEGLVHEIRGHYERRLEKMAAALRGAGFDARMPGGTFYLYVAAPKGAGDVDFASAEEASLFLITEHSISTVPWDDVGAFLRFSATFESAGEDDDDRVLAELARRLERCRLRF